MSQSGTAKPKSKVLLIIGLVCMVIALIAAVLGYMGLSSVKAGFGEIADQMGSFDENDPDRFVEPLNVPGETACQLDVKDYLIWATQPADAAAESVDASDGADADEMENESGFDASEFASVVYIGPDVTWTVTGPSGDEVTVDTSSYMSSGDQTTVGGFSVSEAGEYTIAAESDGDFAGYGFKVWDENTAQQLEEFGTSAGKTAGGALQVIGGFFSTCFFGLIGFILLIIFAVKK
jgi:hypothetical protein